MAQLAQIRRSPPFRRWGRDAIREDRKTQTRRVFGIGRRFYGEAGTIWYKRERPPRGEAGTIWYMGEPLQKAAGSGVHFAKYADDDARRGGADVHGGDGCSVRRPARDARRPRRGGGHQCTARPRRRW